jgi:hypothetical protein
MGRVTGVLAIDQDMFVVLDAPTQGLSTDEVAERLERYGYNEPKAGQKKAHQVQLA